MATFIPPGLGWHRDLPDCRDYAPEHDMVRPMLAKLRRAKSRSSKAAAASCQEFFLPVEHQQSLLSCTAHACIALVECCERRAQGKAIGGSRLFLYKMTRLLHRTPGDGGACLRNTFKAMIRFGLPPELLCPYEVDNFDQAPGPFLYSFAKDYESLIYVRLDPCKSDPAETLAAVKSFVSAGFPVAFGFTVFSCINGDADLPFPSCFDTVRGGQAVVAAGYDDNHRVRSEKGAIFIRNSWGSEWGEGGYGWLPYRYVLEGLSADFWTVIRADWIDSNEFDTLG